MKASEIADALRSGKFTLDTAGHQIYVGLEYFLERYDDHVGCANGSNDGKWSDTSKDVDARMREFYQHSLDREVKQEDRAFIGLTDGEMCSGCGEKLHWVLTGDKVQLRSKFMTREKLQKPFGDYVSYPADYVCPFADAKPFKGEIKVDSLLLFANFFREIPNAIEENQYTQEWSLNHTAGRRRIAEYKASRNVAYGQMGNMSVGIFVNKDKTSILVAEPYGDIEGYENIGVICLEVWRWEATDLNTLKANGVKSYDALEKEVKGESRDLVKVAAKHGVWEFEHYYDTPKFEKEYEEREYDDDVPANTIFSRLTLKN